MATRNKVTQPAIAAAALAIVESHGIDALSMRTLANSLGIKAPSLYDHVANRDAVVALVQSAALEDFGAGFAAAGTSIRAKILFYRKWALANRNLYPVVFQIPLHRELITPGLELKVLSLVVEAAGGSHLRARAVWAQLHGLVDLELQGRFPSDADMRKTWDQVINDLES